MTGRLAQTLPRMQRPITARPAVAAGPIVLAVVAALLVAGVAPPLWTRSRTTPTMRPSASPTPRCCRSTCLATTPAAGTTDVCRRPRPSRSTLTPPRPDSPMPTLAPAVPGPGRWCRPPSSSSCLGPPCAGCRRVDHHPGRVRPGMVSTAGRAPRHLGPRCRSAWHPGSVLRLQQLLAELGYLPLSFTPTAPMTSLTQEADVQQGTFGWRWADQPSLLTSLWTPARSNVITRGAIMDFENQHGLKTDGLPGPQVWTDLLADAPQRPCRRQPVRRVRVGRRSRDRDRVPGRRRPPTTPRQHRRLGAPRTRAPSRSTPATGRPP